MEKDQLRNLTLQTMARIQKIYPNKELDVLNKLANSSYWHDASCIGLTFSKFPEISTHNLIKYAWLTNKTVCVPIMHYETRSLTFYKITSDSEFQMNKFKILEPLPTAEVVRLEAIELLIVPGIVFNNQGYRIGSGGGYYDRLLGKYRGRTVSLAFYEQISNNFHAEKHDRPVDHLITEFGEIKLKARKRNNRVQEFPPLTLSLIIVNVLLFLCTAWQSWDIKPSLDVLLKFGGDYRPLVVAGEWWRLGTAVFLHDSVAHLSLNMFSLYMLGRVIEGMFGRGRFLLIYGGSGIIGALTGLLFLNNHTVSVGASGAIFGLLGSFFYCGFFHKNSNHHFNLINLIMITILNLWIGFSAKGIDNAAHIGGLIGGFLLTIGVEPALKNGVSDGISQAVHRRR